MKHILAELLVSIRSPHTSNIKTRLAYKTGTQRHETTALKHFAGVFKAGIL